MAWSDDRPSTTARGYGAEHQRQRRAWQQVINDQGWPCARGCGHLIVTGERWHLDHADDRATYLGPSCERCNLAAAGRAGKPRRRSTKRKIPPKPGLIQ